jgi:hypothetical protein
MADEADEPIVIAGVVYVESEEQIGDVLVVGEHIPFLDEADIPAPMAKKTRTTVRHRGTAGF